MAVSQSVKYALSLPANDMLRKGLEVSRRRVRGLWRQLSLRTANTYLPTTTDGLRSATPRFDGLSDALAEREKSELVRLSSRFLDHQFDLLGSGWVNIGHAMTFRGFEGHVYTPDRRPSSDAELVAALSPGNRKRSAGIRSMIDADYSPIDWQVDFRSGFRWREDRPSELAPYGHRAGVDIKAPWELARCQHLPLLALAALVHSSDASKGGESSVYWREYRNQVLDFIAANPPGYGVNWTCTMDVAIRAANLAAAHWIFRDSARSEDTAFEQELAASLLGHGRHIANNLEWTAEYRGNHYLANICGLAFVACALPASPETDTWYAFAIDQLGREAMRQFLPEGANFEGSSCYHRLSAEMTLMTTALLLGAGHLRDDPCPEIAPQHWPEGPALPRSQNAWDPEFGPFTREYFARLAAMAEFTIRTTKPDGNVVQVGDNDNGRFLKAGISHLDGQGNENHLDHAGVVAAAAGLLDAPAINRFLGGENFVETSFVRALTGAKRISLQDSGGSAAPLKPTDDAPESASAPATDLEEIVVEIADPDILKGLSCHAYAEFGIYLWRSDRFFLSVRCGAAAHDGRNGHAHNDQLAIELQIDGVDWLADPGCYVYTAAPDTRNLFRSVGAHATPRHLSEDFDQLNGGLFRMVDPVEGICTTLHDGGFEGYVETRGLKVFRAIRLLRDRIVIRDSTSSAPNWDQEPNLSISPSTPKELQRWLGLNTTFSPGYGKLK